MAKINKIIPFSSIDGEGNRMVIFFQGCNFTCTYCHNPETISVCNQCGICVGYCQVHALSTTEGRVEWDDSKCIGCDACIRICPYLSSPKVNELTVEDVFKIIKEASSFIRGITVSGGECTLEPNFLAALFERVKTELHLTCFVDTNGGVLLKDLPELLMWTDGFMLDVKAVDYRKHADLTGVIPSIVHENLRYLLHIEKLIEVRTVIAKGLYNKETVSFVASMIGNKCDYKLIPYRKAGVRETGLKIHGENPPSEYDLKVLLKVAEENGCQRTFINAY